jgi:hypothetical protein
MDAAPHLEDFIRTARVRHTVPLPGGGGHQHKQLLILDGGLGVVAKLAEPDPAASQRVRAEVAAWQLTLELGWEDLVPATALRAVRSSFSNNDVAASVQIAWPFFSVVAETAPPKTVSDCPEDTVWRIAIFDTLCANTDRNDTNWGFVRQLDQPKLIDHGHAFEPGQATTSAFATAKRGQPIPGDLLNRVKRLLERDREAPLREMLLAPNADALFQRATSLVTSAHLEF